MTYSEQYLMSHLVIEMVIFISQRYATMESQFSGMISCYEVKQEPMIGS